MEEACQQGLTARSGCVRQVTVHPVNLAHSTDECTRMLPKRVYRRSKHDHGRGLGSSGGREVVVHRPTPPEDRPFGSTLTLGPHRQRAHGRLTLEGLLRARDWICSDGGEVGKRVMLTLGVMADGGREDPAGR